MKLTDEQIKAILVKDIKSKTILVSRDDLDKIIKEHINDGWTLVKSTELNGRIKVTFEKVK